MKKWYCTAEVSSTTQRPHQVGFSIEAETAQEAYIKASEEARRVFNGYPGTSHDLKLDVNEILQVVQEVEPE